MRRPGGAVWALTALIGGPLSAPLGAVDWTHLLELFRDIEVRVEASSPTISKDAPWSDLKAEFDRLCGQVQVAPSLTEKQIRTLIEDCRNLREALEPSGNPQAKVFLKRLQMCQDFFEYSLEIR